MSSITYRIATGTQAGRKVATLQTIPADNGSLEGDAGKVGGFSLHAGVAAEAHEGQKLERLCRYIARPAISEKRLSLSPQDKVRYQLKTSWKNGTTHVEFEPVEFIAKLAALVPPPRAHLTRFHGVLTTGILPFALRPPFGCSNSLRANLCAKREVARAADAIRRGKRPPADAVSTAANSDHRSPDEKRRAMTPDQVRGRLWAQRLQRVFNIDVSTCGHCGGAVRIVASIEEPTAIRAILAHFAKHGAREHAHFRPDPCAPPAVAA